MLPHKRDRDHLVPVADERKQAMTRPIHKMTTSAAAFIAIAAIAAPTATAMPAGPTVAASSQGPAAEQHQPFLRVPPIRLLTHRITGGPSLSEPGSASSGLIQRTAPNASTFDWSAVAIGALVAAAVCLCGAGVILDIRRRGQPRAT